MEPALNVLGTALKPCSMNPLTGFFRDGCCNTSATDFGSHTVCVELSEEFLEYSKATGNDLSTPMPQFDFPGLKSGDRWCICLPRWIGALEAGMAPRILLRSTEASVLDHVPLEVLEKYAITDD